MYYPVFHGRNEMKNAAWPKRSRRADGGEGQQRDYYTRYLNRSSATTALWSLTSS